MDPTREPRSTPEPTGSGDILPDDAVVAHLRAHAPGLPTERFDARAVTSRARDALRRLRRRRLRNSALTTAGAATAYLVVALLSALVGPVPVPGLGPVSVPGAAAIRDAAAGLFPVPPTPDQWPADVDGLEAEVLPVVEELGVSYYLVERGPMEQWPCILEYSRGNYYSDQECGEGAPFDATARADFDRVTDAIERSGVAVERLRRYSGGIYVHLHDSSMEYNWEYVYLPDVDSPPATEFPGEAWTHIRGDWWFHRAHYD